MEKLKIKDLKKDLFIGDFGYDFVDYSDGCICDIITEIADNNVDIYTQDLLDWVPDNYSYIEEANEELGVPHDFLKQIQQGQYYYNERNIYEHLEDILKNYMYNYIENYLNIEEITEEQNNKLLNGFEFDNNNETLENLIDFINEIMKVSVND